MRVLVLTLALLLAACSSGPTIDDSLTARGQSSRVQYIVVHYTSTDLPRSLALLTQTDVSSHYLIGDNPPTIYRLVDENRRAWHAGVSEWQGRTWLNASTLGIELVNQGYFDGPQGRYWQPYNPAQIDALIVLLKDLVKRHDLPIDSIIGHSDIAPQRKVDPGPLFPWKRLHDAGFGIWPDPAAGDPPPEFDGWLAMAAIGYPLDDRANALQSFRHHFRGMRSQGAELDAEDLRILYGLSRPLLRTRD